MARITKKPDIRQEEIIKTAQALFYSRGFHKTSIQDIVKALNIAQGTFYYHFSSKMDVLDKMTDKMLDTIIEKLEKIVATKMDPIKKLNTLFTATASIKMSNKDTILILLEVLYKKENVIIRHTMNEKSIQRAAPVYAKAISEGIDRGIFHLPHPAEAGTALMELIISTNEGISKVLISNTSGEEKMSAIKRRVELFSHILEKFLGIPTGTIRGFDLTQVKELLGMTE
jgi:AcrR family transcriptional regulator